MKFGVLGTAFWAETVHARALQSHPEAELIGIWGRTPKKTKAAASRLDIRPYDDLASLLEAVDAVTIAVAPEAQPGLAIQAARAGCHLLLEKPIALDVAEAERVRAAIDEAGVRALVFFTLVFSPTSSAWIAETASSDGWVGGRADILLSNYHDESPYRDSAWRKAYGPVWDLGPHALSALRPLGAVRQVDAKRGSGDTVYLTFKHDSGASSTCALSMTMARSDVQFVASLCRNGQTSSMPALTGSQDALRDAFRAAITQLLATEADELRAHPAGIDFGVEVVRVLEQAAAKATAS